MEQAGSGTMDMQHYELRSLFEARFPLTCFEPFPINLHFDSFNTFDFQSFEVVRPSLHSLAFINPLSLYSIHSSRFICLSLQVSSRYPHHGAIICHMRRMRLIRCIRRMWRIYDAYDLELDIPDIGISGILSLKSSFICFDLRHPDDPLTKAIKTTNTFVSLLMVPTDCGVILHFFGFSLYEILHVSTLSAPVACGNSELGAASCLWMWQWWGRATGQSRCVFT